MLVTSHRSKTPTAANTILYRGGLFDPLQHARNKSTILVAEPVRVKRIQGRQRRGRFGLGEALGRCLATDGELQSSVVDDVIQKKGD